jgi:hypothetical protein
VLDVKYGTCNTGHIKHDLSAYPMISFEIVYLFAENKNPEIFAEKLDHVKVICETRSISRKSTWLSLVVMRMVNTNMLSHIRSK